MGDDVQQATQAIPQRNPRHTMIVVTLVSAWAMIGVCAVLAFGAHRSVARATRVQAESSAQAERTAMAVEGMAFAVYLRNHYRLVHVCREIHDRPDLRSGSAEVILRVHHGIEDETLIWDNGELRELLSLCSGVELGQ